MPTHDVTLTDLVTELRNQRPDADIALIERAYAFADAAHKGQLRMSGEPYITHPLHTAYHLVEMHATDPIIVAGLLHDVAEDTPVTLEQISAEFGEDVANICNGICKVGKIKYRGVQRYVENLRKMFLAMASDVRVIVVKFADRLHNLETLESIPQKKAYRIALESLEIYAPIANRLGMGDIKGRLEDAAFKYVMPKEFEWVSKLAEKSMRTQAPQIQKVIDQTRDELSNSGVNFADVHGREKQLYSLYLKLLKHERDIAKIYDLTAIRVIVPSVADCYAALGVVHSKWTPLKGRIKDYISQPKPNGYQSLHTTVFYDRGAIVEFQFRTIEMHEKAEFGIAAHWKYDTDKGKKETDTRIKQILDTKELEWMEQIATAKNPTKSTKKFLESLEELKLDVFKDRIFVYTPKGDVIELPEESTPIDLAYAIHTDIGNKISSALVNDAIHPLDMPLKSGDIVEVIVDKNRKGPNPDWLKFAKTRHAKSKIRQFARTTIADWIKSALPSPLRKNKPQ